MSRRVEARKKEEERLRLLAENPSPPPLPSSDEIIARLEAENAALRRDVADLRTQLLKGARTRAPTPEEIMAAMADVMSGRMQPAPPKRGKPKDNN